MASGTPSAPNNSSRDATDTTAGRIYFSTPSAQVGIPVGDLVFPPAPTCAHTILLGEKIIRERQRKGAVAEKLCGGRIIILRRKNYPAAGAGGSKVRKKIRKLSHSSEKTLFQILIQCETIPYTYTLP